MTVEILSMYNLMPLRVTYKDGTQAATGVTVFVDFVNEKVHGLHPIPSEVEAEIKKIVREKKGKAQNIEVPEEALVKATQLRGK